MTVKQAAQTDTKAQTRVTRPGSAGNQRHRTNGLYVKSENGLKLRARKVRNLSLKVMNALPWLGKADVPAVRAWCELEILCAYAFADLYTNGMLNGKGDGRRLLDDYRKLRIAQFPYTRALGMTPESRMALRVSDIRARALKAGIEEATDEDVEAVEARLLAQLTQSTNTATADDAPARLGTATRRTARRPREASDA